MDFKDISGVVLNGVVVIDGAPALPEGAVVTITYPAIPRASTGVEKGRIQVPLVRTGAPATVNLTGARIAEILDEHDATPRR